MGNVKEAPKKIAAPYFPLMNLKFIVLFERGKVEWQFTLFAMNLFEECTTEPPFST